MKILALGIFALFFHNAAFAACPSLFDSKDGCLIDLQDIHPTQFGVGFREVQHKAEKLSEKNPRELKEHLKSHPVEGILGPRNIFYAIDSHHFALAAQQVGIKSVYIEILKDYSDLSPTDFWKKMAKGGWVHLYKLSEGPFAPKDLPKTLRDMIDDPYRSLASQVRRLGGFEKSTDRYSEFPWAEFFRQYVKIENDDLGFQKAIHAGYVLARSPLAKKMAGYLGGDDDSCAAALSKTSDAR